MYRRVTDVSKKKFRVSTCHYSILKEFDVKCTYSSGLLYLKPCKVEESNHKILWAKTWNGFGRWIKCNLP